MQVTRRWHAQAMTEGEASQPLRIGNTERTSAMKALDEHLAEGRLGAEEYGEEVEQRRGWIDQWGPRLVAVSPFVALALFLLTRQWYFFLLIPAAGALFYGGRGHDTDAERRDRRDERRDRRRDR